MPRTYQLMPTPGVVCHISEDMHVQFPRGPVVLTWKILDEEGIVEVSYRQVFVTTEQKLSGFLCCEYTAVANMKVVPDSRSYPRISHDVPARLISPSGQVHCIGTKQYPEAREGFRRWGADS